MQVYDLMELRSESREEHDGTLVHPDYDACVALAVAMCEAGATVEVHTVENCQAADGDCTCPEPPVSYGPKLSETDWDQEDTKP